MELLTYANLLFTTNQEQMLDTLICVFFDLFLEPFKNSGVTQYLSSRNLC